jgi:hypothetical protein
MQIRARYAGQFLFGCVILFGCFLAGCQRATPARVEFPMGEKVPVGPLIYNVVESGWRTQFGDVLDGLRIPQQRFLSINLSVTNSGGGDVSVPLFTLENANGQSFMELQDGKGVDNWFGLLRTIAPAQTQQGKIIFDVPLASYKLRVTDGAGPGAEKFAWIDIPLRMDVDTDAPTPGLGLPDGK